jgi:hypothetical protein
MLAVSQLVLVRYAVLIAVRDFLIPLGGLYLAVRLPTAGALQAWHRPLIAGMLGTPLVARGESPPDKPASLDGPADQTP